MILTYQKEHPEFEKEFKQYDLFVDAFLHSCLNRLQFANNKQMVDLTDPAAALQFIGTIKNPVSKYKHIALSLEASTEKNTDMASEVEVENY